MFGAITLIPNSTPAAVKINTTPVDSTFAQSGLTRSPMISLSFTSMNRNTNAGGIARTATTLTTRTTYTSGSPGIRTIAAAATAHRVSTE